jgi:hypothetical protein
MSVLYAWCSCRRNIYSCLFRKCRPQPQHPCNMIVSAIGRQVIDRASESHLDVILPLARQTLTLRSRCRTPKFEDRTGKDINNMMWRLTACGSTTRCTC